jgi:hypothetical protein
MTAKKKTTKKKTTAKKAPVAAPVPKVSEADVIWAEIRGLPIDMFSLPNQRVEDHTSRRVGIPDACLLVLKSQAVLPSLEATLAVREQTTTVRTAEGDPVTKTHPKYVLEEAEGYVLVKRHVPLESRPELKPLGPHVVLDK